MFYYQYNMSIPTSNSESGTVIALTETSWNEVCAYKLCFTTHWCGKALIRLFCRMPPRFSYGKRVCLVT